MEGRAGWHSQPRGRECGALSTVRLINESMRSEGKSPHPTQNIDLQPSLEMVVFLSLGRSCEGCPLCAPQEKVHMQAAFPSAASSQSVVFLVFSFSRSTQPDGLFLNALCVGWMCVWRSCQLHKKEERAKESTSWCLSLVFGQSEGKERQNLRRKISIVEKRS